MQAVEFGCGGGEVSTRQSNSRSTSLSCRHLLISALIKAGVVVFMGRQGSSVSCRRRRNCSPLQHPIPPSLSTHLIIVLHALCPSYCFFLPCLSLARVCQHLTPPAGTHNPWWYFFQRLVKEKNEVYLSVWSSCRIRPLFDESFVFSR